MKKIATIVLMATLTLAVFGCTTGASQDDIDTVTEQARVLHLEVQSLKAQVSSLEETAITTENVGDVMREALADWGGQVVRDAVEELGAEVLGNIQEQIETAVAEAIVGGLTDSFSGFGIPWGDDEDGEFSLPWRNE